MKTRLIFFCAALFLVCCGLSSAGGFMNGSFETDPFDIGWINVNGPATVHAGLVAGSTQAARINPPANDLGQVFDALGPEWVVEAYIAVPDYAAYSGANRSFNLLLNNNTDPSVFTLPGYAINLRIAETVGSIQLYDNAHGGGWANAASGGEITWSVDGNSDGDFSDPEDTLNVHRLQIVGHNWGTATVSYDVYISAANSDVLVPVVTGSTKFQNAVPDGSGANDVVTSLYLRSGFGFVAEQFYVADNVYVGDGNSASVISPLGGAEDVLRTVPLLWGDPPLFDPIGYNVWVHTDPNNVTAGRKVVDGTLQNSYTEPGDGWEMDTEYGWRVDAIEAGNIVHEGVVGTFTTIPPQPFISQAPGSITVPPATPQVELTVVAENAVTYTWYKDSVVTGGNTATLVIPNAELGDSVYTCKLSNGIPADDVTTDPARVMIEKLVGHWKFEQSLTNEVAGGGDGTGDPNYVTGGIDGYAYEIGDENFVQISGSEEYYNFYPQGLTAIAWIKTTAGQWDGVVSKRSVVDEPASQEGWVIMPGLNASGVGIEGIGMIYGPLVDSGSWRMMVMSYDPEDGILRYYLDGVLVAQSNPVAPENIPLNDQMLVFGSSTGQGRSYYDGLVDEIKVYNYAIDPFVIAEEFTTLKPDGGPVCVENPEMDITGPNGEPDCKVDLYDITVVAAQWLDCNIVPSSYCF